MRANGEAKLPVLKQDATQRHDSRANHAGRVAGESGHHDSEEHLQATGRAALYNIQKGSINKTREIQKHVCVYITVQKKKYVVGATIKLASLALGPGRVSDSPL